MSNPRSGVPFNPTDLPPESDEAERAGTAKEPRAMPLGIPIDRDTYERLKRDSSNPKLQSNCAQEDAPAVEEDDS
jgi:hypothetical protein